MSNVVTNARLVAVLAILVLAACTREDFTGPSGSTYEGELVETSLSLSVAGVKIIGTPMNAEDTPSASAPQTRTASQHEVLEKQVNDIWVFQFDAQGSKQVTAPRYYDQLSTDSEGKTPFNIMLRPYENCLLYIVANTNNATWAQNMAAYSVADLNKQTFTYQSETQLYEDGLPMVAQRTGTTIAAGTENKLDIELKSLVAKIQFCYKLGDAVAGQMHITGVHLYNVPNRVRLGNALEQVTGVYPEADDFVSIDKEYPELSDLQENEIYTWYIPQTLQGTVTNNVADKKNQLAPANALYIRAYVDSQMDGGSYAYTMYPGANTTNDYNLKGGCCYNVQMNINSEKTDNRVLAAPANCFVTKTGATLRFNPYERTETGGGWNYSDYVNKNNAQKKITKVDILWQTGDGTHFAIGNNTNGDRVKIEDDIITVTTGDAEGNAVIAGYNASNEIVWSWHIWVNNSSPAQLSRAVPYTTYQWDKNGIYPDKPRVKRQSVMACNLGALADEPGDNPQKTYGLWYQWGRKDPFPIGKHEYYVDYYEYSSDNVIPVYDRTGTAIKMTSTAGTDELFQSLETNASIGTIDYAIKHPTHLLYAQGKTLINEGDWLWGHNDKLWGATPFIDAKTVFQIDEDSYLSDNGATEKSIFDPCPAGWMMPPNDMWLGFTKTGLNVSDATYASINCVEKSKDENTQHRGFHMYMDGAKWDGNVQNLHTCFFPSVGMRNATGKPLRAGICGNYHTSTPVNNGMVNVLHLHTTAMINIFDEPYSMYRSIAGSVRCVREHE